MTDSKQLPNAVINILQIKFQRANRNKYNMKCMPLKSLLICRERQFTKEEHFYKLGPMLMHMGIISLEQGEGTETTVFIGLNYEIMPYHYESILFMRSEFNQTATMGNKILGDTEWLRGFYRLPTLGLSIGSVLPSDM